MNPDTTPWVPARLAERLTPGARVRIRVAECEAIGVIVCPSCGQWSGETKGHDPRLNDAAGTLRPCPAACAGDHDESDNHPYFVEFDRLMPSLPRDCSCPTNPDGNGWFGEHFAAVELEVL